LDRDIDRIIGALTSPVRREILALVWDRELQAGEIASAFRVTKPTISEHLRVLRDAELVSMVRAGTSRRYRARPESLDGLRGALEGERKWIPADDVPERSLASVRTARVVVVTVDVETDQQTTFAALTDADVFSRWLGGPVRIEDGRFAATLEWGTEVRGRYDVVCAPELIVMRWDFDDETVPVPGAPLTGYVSVRASSPGAVVEVHQIVDTREQESFMRAAWASVLGRLRAGVSEASRLDAAVPPRARRAKRRTRA
jgi:DNA-binding transcriptional ArsR family regulator